MSHTGLESFLIICHGAAEWQACKIGKVVGSQGRTKALLAQGFEHRPSYSSDIAGIAFKHVVPMLGNTGHVEGSQLDFVCFSSALSTEEMVTTIQPTERIFLAIKGWKGQFMVTWNTKTIVVISGMCTRKMVLWWVGWELRNC
jgi:hypothetical protein